MQPVRVRVGLCVAAIAVAGQALGASADAGAGASAADSSDTNPPKPAAAPSVTLEEVVVATNRYEATDLQLKSANSVSVLSAEDLANTAVHNAAEALGLLPAVNVLNTSTGSYIGGVDSAARAEGMFTSIRGMNAEFNVNLVNGVNVAQGMPYSREVQLSLLPPSGLKTVVLNKTSRADMDGDAIGGTVDFRTPTAFDFAQPFTSVTAGMRLESRPIDYGQNGLGYNFGAELARRFGSDQQFGLYVSGYYTLRHFVNSEMGGVMESGCCDNGWKFKVTDANGNSPPGIDPAQNVELTAFNVGTSAGFTKQFGGSTALDWQPDETLTAYAHLTYAYALTQQDSNLSQIVAMNVLTGGPTATSPGSPFVTPQGYYQPDLQNVSIRYWLETNPEVAELGTFQVGVDKKIDTWTFSPNLFYSWGRDDRPNHIEIDTRTSHVQGGDITDNGFPYGQTSLVTYANGGFPYANLTPEMTAQLYNIRGLPAFDRGELQKGYSGQKKGGAKFDVRKDFSEQLELRAGVKYTTSSRKVTNNDWTNPGFFDGSTFGSLPIWNGDYRPVFPGKYPWSVPKIDEDKLLAYYGSAADPIRNLDTCGGVVNNGVVDEAAYQNSLHCNDQMATEDVSAAYAMVTLHPGKLEITPGVRFEHTYIHNKYWLPPGGPQPQGFYTNHTIYNEALPSIFVNYRPDSLTVYRAGIWKSYTKPAYVKLGGGASVSPSDSGATTVTLGNPGLKPIEAINYDLSGEWDNGNGRHILLGGFFKTLKDYYYDSIVSQQPTNSIGGGFVFKMPLNAGSGQVWGIETGARQKFTFLPAPLDGFGISGNLTREHTLVHLNVPGFDPSSPIENAPDWLANLEFFYDKGGLNVGLLYNYNGQYLSQYDPLSQGSNWDDLWVRPVWRLDMHAGYAFDNGLKLDLSVSNLTRNYTYWSHLTKHSLAVSDIVDSGLTGFFNVTYKF